jgi:hypothetical protein
MTIKGSYGFKATLARPASPMPGAPIMEAVGIGVRTFDGQGNFTGRDFIKSVTTPAGLDLAVSGTYKINPDCTGMFLLTVPGQSSPAELRMVVVNKGREIFWMLVNPVEPMTLVHAVKQ